MRADRARRRVEDHEASMDPARRRALAAHYTPERLARRLVRLALEHRGTDAPLLGGEASAPVVCDPSCGAGSILLAAAEALVESGLSPRRVLEEHLVGFDIDPAALVSAREALLEWGRARGVDPAPRLRLAAADALAVPAVEGVFDVVVGNPPFSSPLSAKVQRPEGAPVGAYVDLAAVHLLAAVRATPPGGIVCMLQPQSVLAARDSATLRRELDDLATLDALWGSDEEFFDGASVRVCAPLLRRREEPPPGTAAARQRVVAAPGAAARGRVGAMWRNEPPRALDDPGPEAWASLLATMSGVPLVQDRGGVARVCEVARCTAGFRDEFYALAPLAREAEQVLRGLVVPSEGDREVPLVSSGMIDPGVLRWGTGAWRMAGVRWRSPVVPAEELARRSPRVAEWVERRRVPKVLVASQTKVIEAAVDRGGGFVPLTPVVSVEPRHGLAPEVLAAVLSAPSNSALLWSRSAGTGRSSGSLRVGAAKLSELVFAMLERPEDPGFENRACDLWGRLEELAAGRAALRQWEELGSSLDELVGFPGDPAVVSWWVQRLPTRVCSRDI